MQWCKTAKFNKSHILYIYWTEHILNKFKWRWNNFMWRCDMFLFYCMLYKGWRNWITTTVKSVHQRWMTKNRSFHSMSPSLQWHSVGLTNLANSYEFWTLRRPSTHFKSESIHLQMNSTLDFKGIHRIHRDWGPHFFCSHKNLPCSLVK